MINKSLYHWLDEFYQRGRIGQGYFFEGLLACSENRPVPEILAAIESNSERARKIKDQGDHDRATKFRKFVQSMEDVKSDEGFINVNSEMDWGVKEIQRFIKYWREVNPDWPTKSAREDIEASKLL